MKNLKYQIFFTILFIAIGIAAVTTNLTSNVSTPIVSNQNDFLVYFSNVKVNGTQDVSLAKSEKELVFDGEFSAIGDKKVITYDVTNASKNYDAEVSISCTNSTTYLTISNSFDTNTNLSASSTKSGTLTIELTTAVSSETTQEIKCTINANAIERTTQGSGSVSAPAYPFYIGSEISIGTEKFNVISDNGDTITMLAQYNISDSTYKQTAEQRHTIFSDVNGWEYTSGPKDIEIQNYDGPTKTLLNNYVSYLNGEYGVNVIGDLITVEQLGNLGCTVPTDYALGDGGWTCTGSEHRRWLINGQHWWTRSAYFDYSDFIWFMFNDGYLDALEYDFDLGVRPVITISKDTLENL